MPFKRQRPSGSWEYIVKNRKLLGPNGRSFTADTEEEGDARARFYEEQLDAGIIPADFLKGPAPETLTFKDLFREYLLNNHPSENDKERINKLAQTEELGNVPLSEFNYPWCETWLASMKRIKNLAPPTIRHYVGAVRRCFDWAEKTQKMGITMNWLHRLPDAYAIYTPADAQVCQEKGKSIKHATERDRRIWPDEEAECRRILAGGKPNDRYRPFECRRRAALELLFTLALETGMRMREMYTLTIDQVSLGDRTVYLDKTKNGSKRQVPLSTVAVAAIKEYQEHVANGTRGMFEFAYEGDRFFPWWNGATDKKRLSVYSSQLSNFFGRVFDAAGCADVHFHDLRHEAISRMFERTTMSEFEIAKISGHKSMRNLARYANLRGSNLAEKLW